MTILSQMNEGQRAEFLAAIGAAGGLWPQTLPGEQIIPDALGWPAAYPVVPTITSQGDGTIRGSAGWSPFDGAQYQACVAGPQYFVSPTGSDSANGTSTSTPFLTMDKATQTINAAGVPATINLLPPTSGYMGRASSQFGVITAPTVDIAIRPVGRRARLGTYDLYGTSGWAANSTYAWVQQRARSSVARVTDPSRTVLGLHRDRPKVASLEACSRLPGSWYADGTNVYVYPEGGEALSDANVRVYLNIPLFRYVPALNGPRPNLFLEGLDLEGGTEAVFFVFLNTSSTAFADSKTIAARSCTFRYGGAAASQGGVYASNWHGLLNFEDCDASAPWSDGFNFHNTIPGVASMYTLTVNCSARDVGRGGVGILSNNGLTSHDSNLRSIDIAGAYEGCRGRTVHIIDDAKMLCIGTRAIGSLGDRGNGGSFDPCEFAAGGTSQLWLNRCDPRPFPGALSIAADDTAAVRMRGASIGAVGRAKATDATIGTY